MSKTVLSIALVVVAIAIPFAAPAIAGAIGLAGALAISATAAAAIVGAVASIGLAIAANVLLGPGSFKVPGSLADGGRARLLTSFDLITPRKIVFGNTAMATDVRYTTFTGEDQEFLEEIIAVASHAVNSIDEIYYDNELAWTSAGGAQGRFVGYLTIVTRLEGTSANGIAIDATWTANCRLTGCAYFHAKHQLSDISETDKSPFATGVSARRTVRGKGAKVYDPRLDSTVAGGSGAHRAATQATWAWNDNGSRNLALQLLWYLLGWDINGKLAVGMGTPAARIDLPSFITGANICDESIALNGGGTEPRYRGDGVLSEGDDRTAVIEVLCAHMNATLRDTGGKISLQVLKNDLASPAASFTESDILQDGKWAQTPDVHRAFNIVRGQRIDPSDVSLYQPVDYAEVSLASIDGIDRVDTTNYPLCQSNGQAQRLAKQRLQRNQYQGRYEFTGGPRWWQVNCGDVVQLSHQSLGWSNKLFRLVGQAISRGGDSKIMLLEENAACYAWDNSEAAAVVAGVPTVYDPLNSPILQGIITGNSAASTNALTDTQFGKLWTRSAGVLRRRAQASSGYAKGNQPYFADFTPSTSQVRSAKSELIKVSPGQRVYFKIDAQRGTTLGSGSRLNMGHEWIQADGVSTTGSPVEGTQQTPSSLTAGAAPKSIFWSDVAPAAAAFVRIKPYTPALASSSGSFRVEAPVISIVDLGGAPSLSVPISAFSVDYDADGTVVAGELPFDIGASMLLGNVVQTAGVAWTYKVKSGNVNGHAAGATAYAMTGTGSGVLTVNSIGADESTVEITAVAANGSSAISAAPVSISKVYAPAAPGPPAAGDTTSQTSGFTAINSTTFVAVTSVLTFTTPAGQTSATTTVNLHFKPTKTGGNGNWTVEAKVQRNVSSVWTDVGATFSGPSDVETDDTGIVLAISADLAGTRQSTGLTAGVAQQYRVVARLTSGTRSHSTTGSVSVASP